MWNNKDLQIKKAYLECVDLPILTILSDNYMMISVKKDQMYDKFAILAILQAQLWLYLTKSVT